MLLWIWEGSHSSVCGDHQRLVKEPNCATLVRLVKVPFSVLAVSRDTFKAGTAWKDANTVLMCAADTARYHIHFLKKRHSLSDGMHYLSGFK